MIAGAKPAATGLDGARATHSPARDLSASDFRLLRRFLGEGGARPQAFVLPVTLAVGAGVFEAISLWLLVSLTRGMLEMDFGFVPDLPVVGRLFTLLPAALALRPWAPFAMLAGLVFFVFVAKNVLQYASALGTAREVRRVVNTMRNRLVERCLEFGKLFFDRTNAGYLHSVVLSFTEQVAAKLIDLQQFFASIVLLLAYLGMMFYISWKLTLIGAAVFPLLNFSQAWLIRRIRRTSAANVDAQAEMSRKLFNVLSCVLLVKSYGTEAREQRAFSEISERARRYEFSIDKKILLILPAHEVIVLALLLLLVSTMAFIVAQQGAGRLPGFVVYFYAIRRAAAAFGVVSHLKATLASVRGPVADVLQLLDGSGKHIVSGGREEFPGLHSRIEFVELHYAYGDGRPVLRGLSLAVERGQMTAIVGPSGAGKTTVVNLLARFYEAPRGSILIDGKDIAGFTLASLRRAISMVSQDAALLNDSLLANITYGQGDVVMSERLAEVVRKARLEEYVSRLPEGLLTSVGDRGVQLSGGEKQRIAIARAMLKGSEILVLDEATSALDSRTELMIQDAIEEMIEGKTAIVIAHRLSTIQKANRIAVLEEGRIVEQGTLAELLERRGAFYGYWQDQKFD